MSRIHFPARIKSRTGIYSYSHGQSLRSRNRSIFWNVQSTRSTTSKKEKKKEISSKPIQHYPIVDLDDIKKENIGESGERRGESRQGGSSQIAILAIPELGAGGRRSTKWPPPISPSPTTTSATTRYRKLFEKGRDARPWEVVPCERSLPSRYWVNAIKGLFVDFFCRTTRTSWRTGVGVGTARQVARGGTRGITAIIISIRTIWWVVSLPFFTSLHLTDITSFFLPRILPFPLTRSDLTLELLIRG